MNRFAIACALVVPLGLSGDAVAQPVPEAPAEAPTDVPAEAPADAPADARVSDDEPSDEADDDLDRLLGSEVVTTASRSAELSSTAPAHVNIVGGEAIRRFGMRTLNEVLLYLGLGVYTQDTGADLYTELDVGASGVMLHNNGRHVLLLVDGHVMNSQTNGESSFGASFGVPLEAIDHVEVMLGPGSVVYGSNAMLGVVNVVTRVPRGSATQVTSELSIGVPTGVDGRMTRPTGAHRFGVRHRIGVATSGVAGPAASPRLRYAIALDFQSESSASYESPLFADSDLYEIAPGEFAGGVFSHDMRSPSGHATFVFGNFRLSLQGNAYSRTVPWTGIMRTEGTGNRSHAVRLDLTHEVDVGRRTSLRTRVYGDATRLEQRSSWLHSYWCYPGQIYGCDYRHANAAHVLGVEEQVTIDFGLDGRNVVMVGGDLRMRNAVGRPADSLDLVTGEPGAEVRQPYYQRLSALGALFAQYAARLGDSASLNVGARFDADSLFGVRVSPRAALSADLGGHVTMRVGYSEAFRAPSAEELFASDPTYIIAPTELDAEVARSADLEFQQQLDRGQWNLRGFGAVYTDFILSDVATMAEFDAARAAGRLASTADPSYTLVLRNLDRIVSLGGTASGSYSPIDGLEFGVNLTFARTFLNPDLDLGNGWNADPKLPVLPDLYGNARVSYAFDGGVALSFVAAFTSLRRAYGYAEYGGSDLPSVASRQADLRGTVSGPIGRTGLSYRVGGSFSVNPVAPYLFGYGPTAAAPDDTFALTPLGRGYGFLSLEYRPDAN